MTDRRRIETGASPKTPDDVRAELIEQEEETRTKILLDLGRDIPGSAIAYRIPAGEETSLYPGLGSDAAGEAAVEWLGRRLADLREQYGTVLVEPTTESREESDAPNPESVQIWEDTEQY